MAEERKKFTDDETVIAYQFVNDMKKGDVPVKTSSGHTVQTVSALRLGKGGIDAGYDAQRINAELAERKLTGFVNGSVIVYKLREGAGGSQGPTA